MTTAPSTTPPADCPFCDKHGLPILPVRYAIARADLGHAPALPANFKAGVASVPLPADIAAYTLRLLRPGYLYMFDEHRNEWSGYVVNEQSYLYEFDVHAKSPPKVGTQTFNDACKSKSDPYKARCITVKDAGSATKVWLGFSDVAWTADVLAKHAKPAYRQAHMQCIDMTMWRGGGAVAQMATFDALNQVAEFAADGAALQKETREYFTRFLPPPYVQPEDMLKTDDAARKAFGLMSPMIRQLLPGAVGRPQTYGVIAAAAWAFSPQPFHMTHDEAAAFATWGTKAAKPSRPAIVGLSDPAGIAIELNGLAIQNSVEFTDDKQRKWKYETALVIQSLQGAVKNGAVQDEIASRELSVEISNASALNLAGSTYFDDYQKKVADAGSIGDDERKKIGEATWPKYTKYFKAREWTAYLNPDDAASYDFELKSFGRKTLSRLDVSYLAWLKSAAFRDYLSHNYDSNHIGSGQAYTDLVTAVIRDATSRNAVFEYLQTSLTEDPDHPDAWLMRALALNHVPLIQKLKQEAMATSLEWADLADKSFDKFKDVIIKGAAGQLTGPLDSVARFVYQVTGPLIDKMSVDLNTGLAFSAQKFLSTRWQMAVLGSVARAGNQDLVLVDLRGEWSRKQAARTLAGMLAKVTGGDQAMYRSGARAALDKMGQIEGPVRPFNGVILLDKAEAAKLTGLSGAARRGALSAVLKPAEIDKIMQDSVGKLGNLEVKAGIVQAVLSGITLKKAYRDMIDAKPENALGKTVNFAAGVVGLTGGIAGTAGALLEKTTWGATKSAQQFEFMTIQIESRASWFTGTGKLFGAIGGFIAGVVSIKEATEMSDNHPVLRLMSFVAGVGSAALSIAVLFFGVSAGIGLLIGLAIAIISFAVGWLKPNDVQNWLEQSLSFGGGVSRFSGPIEQALALNAMAKGD